MVVTVSAMRGEGGGRPSRVVASLRVKGLKQRARVRIE